MGTKIDRNSYVPVNDSMRDLNEDSSSSSWPQFSGDKTLPNGQYYNGFVPRTTIDSHPEHDKNAVKQKILEHESVFKNQVYELHRLYRIQRDMMEGIRKKEIPHRLRESMEPSSSSSFRGSQAPSQDARKLHMAGFPFQNSDYGRASTAGVEIINSPMSCTRESNRQPAWSISRDEEALALRPLKVRKKLFDLHLPADEYVDVQEGGKYIEVKPSNISSYAPNGTINTTESSRKLSIGRAGLETDYRLDPPASASCLRNPTGLADLNEPIEIEEARAPSTVGFLDRSFSNGETKSMHPPVKLNARHLSINNGETVHLSNGFSTNSVESKVNETGHLSYMHETGSSSKINFNSSSHVLEQGKLHVPSHLVQAMPKSVDQPSGIYLTSYGRDIPWREGSRLELEPSNRRHDCFDNVQLESLVASQSSFPFSGSSCLNSSWAHSGSSWVKGKSSFSQRVPTTLESSSHSATEANRCSAQSLGPFGENRRAGACARPNPHHGGELPVVNGFYHGYRSGAKELKVHLPSSGFDCLSYSKANTEAPSYTIHGPGNFSNGPCHVDLKPALDIDLNEVVSKGSLDEAGVLRDQTSIDGKTRPGDHLSALPWLNRKAFHGDKAANNSKTELIGDLNKLHDSSSVDKETVRDLNQPLSPNTISCSTSSDWETVKKNKHFEAPRVKKLLGFPIFETGALEKEMSSNVSTSASVVLEGKSTVKERKKIIIDINLECEPDEHVCEDQLNVEKGNLRKGDSIRECIDLNSCASEGEDALATSHECRTINGKVALEIDLETPISLDHSSPLWTEDTVDKATMETLDNKSNDSQDEVLRNAAEVMVSISMFCPQIDTERIFCKPEASLEDSLLWFVNALSSCPNELESTSGMRKGFDEFEATTLRLRETKEEDYLPVSFVPEVQTTEETGGIALATRSRRGQTRRGRQRRDFQRDILPGLVSLSRPEVTEDLQIFGSLMRATGHQWASGLTRRNGTKSGGGRGRRRHAVELSIPAAIPTPVCTPLVQQLNSIEAGLEDRSLTGWGKTTRRPRRQRCPAGNPPTIVLT